MDADRLSNELIDGEGFDARVNEVRCGWESDDLEVEGKFLYLTFRDGKPTIDEFVDFIFEKIVAFCLPTSEVDKIEKLVQERGLPAARSAFERAEKMFIQAIKSRRSGGEPGELILFIFLEMVMKAPQIVAKMNLKTSTNMPVHGSDGIHARADKKSDNLFVYWGESKLYKKFSDGVSEAIESVIDFHDDDTEKRKHEVGILQNHASLSDENLERELVDYFNPYKPKSNKVKDYNACFVGFNYKAYEKIESANSVDRKDIFLDMYKDRIESGCELMESKIHDYGGDRLRYVFFLLPLKSVDQFRGKFFDKLGVPTDD